MTSVTRDENREGEAIGCGHFRRGRGGGGEEAPQCRRRTTQQSGARWPGRSKAVASI
jgi:hypothetical protein